MTDSAEKDPEQGPETEPSPEEDRPPRSANATLQEPSARRSTAAQVSEPSARHRDPDFGPRYRVVSLLGKGGMGEVYRAYDVELKGEVALKVVSTDGDTDEALTRFRREIALARKVTNPNVLRVYDLADFRGLRFLSMEYVEGEDLGALLKREKRIPIERALQIFRQIAAGLAAAHAGGVVHRDLKPANILVDREGNVRIADFGLARSVTESGMTQSGSVLGSPSYMSPEQVKGEPTDGRSDIYSLGVMLYQLVSGQTPFQAPTSHAVMEMRLHKRPQPLREVAPEASLQIERVVDRCLEVEVDKRYPNVAAMLADLDNDPSRTAATVPPPSVHSPSGVLAAQVPPKKRGFAIGLGIAGAAVIAGAVGLAAVHNPSTAQNLDASANVAPTPSGTGIAGGALVGTNDPVTTLVVGMENHTLESEFDGTLDFLVRSTLRRSTRVDPSAGAQVRRLASELGPDQKVDESLGKALFDRDHRRVITVRGRIDSKGAGFTLSLTAKDAGTGQTVVDTTMDAAALDRVVPTIAKLSCELRRALGEKISSDESEKTGLSASLIADHEYSLSAATFEVGNYTSAADHLALALAQDPGFSSAHARRAIALRNLQREEESSKELQLALKTIDQMAERDRLKLLGDYYQYSTEELDRAVASYSELLAKWPRDDAAETNLANAYQARGETPKALELARRGASEHPQDLVLRGDVAAFDLGVDDFEGAVTDVRKMLTELPRPTTAMHDYLVIALAALGRHDEVMQALPAYRAIDPSNSAAFEADFAMSEGRLKDAKTILDKAIADDLAAKNPDGAEIKLAMLAELSSRKGDKAGTHDAAAKIKAQPQRRFTAAMALLAIGDAKGAKAISASLGTELAPSRRVMAKMIDAEALRIAGKPRDAMLLLQDAIKLVDTSYAHFLLARAALDAKEYGEAYSELQHCQSHRGGFANSVDDVSAVRQLPLFTYYLAEAQDGLGSAQSTASYQTFLGMMHEPDADDPYVVDARKHAAATTPAK